jgi:hypothetical protein
MLLTFIFARFSKVDMLFDVTNCLKHLLITFHTYPMIL